MLLSKKKKKNLRYAGRELVKQGASSIPHYFVLESPEVSAYEALGLQVPDVLFWSSRPVGLDRLFFISTPYYFSNEFSNLASHAHDQRFIYSICYWLCLCLNNRKSNKKGRMVRGTIYFTVHVYSPENRFGGPSSMEPVFELFKI
jgi:hypothetical protein